jgi:hypothetical protein
LLSLAEVLFFCLGGAWFALGLKGVGLSLFS